MSGPEGRFAGEHARVLTGVGASAGGVQALIALVRELPPQMPAALLVALHVSRANTSALAAILQRAGPLAATTATDGTVPLAGCIYVAPPDRHLLLHDGVLELSAGPPEHGHRPAIDPMFRSLAGLGAWATGVILSGTQDDGTAGLGAIKAAGGRALVQAPEEAAYDGMIQSAIANVEVDAVLPVAEIAARLVRFANAELELPAT